MRNRVSESLATLPLCQPTLVLGTVKSRYVIEDHWQLSSSSYQFFRKLDAPQMLDTPTSNIRTNCNEEPSLVQVGNRDAAPMSARQLSPLCPGAGPPGARAGLQVAAIMMMPSALPARERMSLACRAPTEPPAGSRGGLGPSPAATAT